MSEKPKYAKKLNIVIFPERVKCPYCPEDFKSNVSLCRHVLGQHNWNKEPMIILDQVKEIYKALKLAQKGIVFGSKTEPEAKKRRLRALGEVTTTLYNFLKDFGQEVED